MKLFFVDCKDEEESKEEECEAWEKSNQRAELVNPALKGAIKVLKTCAIVAFYQKSGFDIFIGRNVIHWKVLSKTLAEEAAWKFSKDNGLDFVVVNAGCAIGPTLQPTINYSVKIILDLTASLHARCGEFWCRSSSYANGTFKCVAVRDVANANIQAFEVPLASGRYCFAATVTHFSKIIETTLPLFQLPAKYV
ncbi:hypothetical protein Ancab_034993 [Ancistrocladus abbreviatus]